MVPLGSMNISRRALFSIALHLSLAGAFLLLALRMFFAGTDGYFFLVWNVFLAAIPYAMAVWFERIAVRQGHMTWILRGFFLFWLFFFPNAPYIVTDFVHLPWEYTQSKAFAYDFSLIGAFAAVGLLFGMGSLFRMHRALRKLCGLAWSSFAVGVAIVLSGFGVYLGRFLRWNSWDAFLNPFDVLRDTVSHYGDPAWFARAVTLSIFFSACIGLGYLFFLALYWLIGVLEDREHAGSGE